MLKQTSDELKMAGYPISFYEFWEFIKGRVSLKPRLTGAARPSEQRLGGICALHIHDKYHTTDIRLDIPSLYSTDQVQFHGSRHFFLHDGQPRGPILSFFCPAADGQHFGCRRGQIVR